MKAFPSNGFFEKTNGGEQPQKLNPVMGMDLRDYFAAKAMSMIPYTSPLNEYNEKHFQDYMIKASNFCYQIADEMMKASEK